MAVKVFVCVEVRGHSRILLVDAGSPMLPSDRSKYLRNDGGHCFELPPWQHNPVDLEQHLLQIKERYPEEKEDVDSKNQTSARKNLPGSRQKMLMSSEVSRYMDTVLGPFLDTYHRNIQNSYQQFTDKLMKRIKFEILDAVVVKNNNFRNLSDLANELNIPVMCNEELREIRTLSSTHVANVYQCTEDARAMVLKMGHYAEEMIKITKKHIHKVLDDATLILEAKTVGRKEPDTNDVAACLKELSRASVSLGYDLDMSLTNAKRHAEQSCDKLTNCVIKIRKDTDEEVGKLREMLYQCVYA